MKHLYLITTGLLFVQLAGSQTLERQVISANGGFETNGDLSLSWTMGELSTNQYTGGNIVIREGFQQADACAAFRTAPTDLSKSFEPVNGIQDRVQLKWYKASPSLRYSNFDAAACDVKFWPYRTLDPASGNVIGPIIENADTTFFTDRKKFLSDGVSPREIFKWPVKYRADGANNSLRAEPNIRYRWQVRCACQHGAGPESPWSEVKIFNTPDFDPNTGIYTGTPIIDSNDESSKLIETLSPRFNVYPNPSSDIVYLDWKDLNQEKLELILSNQHGQTVMQMEVQPKEDGRLELNLLEYQNGIYHLNLFNNQGTRILSKQIIKLR